MVAAAKVTDDCVSKVSGAADGGLTVDRMPPGTSVGGVEMLVQTFNQILCCLDTEVAATLDNIYIE